MLLAVAVGTFLACISCSSSIPAMHYPELNQLIELERDSTVALVRDEVDEVTGKHFWFTYCSGVWISDDLILTAYHCVHNKYDDLGVEVGNNINVSYYLDLRTPDKKEAYFGESHPSTVVKIEPKSDLALLRVKEISHGHHKAYINTRPILDGSSVMIVGHPTGLLYTWVNGTVAASRWLEKDDDNVVKVLHITSPTWFGNSGGAAFDMDGRIVGIASFIMIGGDRSFFIHRDIIVEFLVRDDNHPVCTTSSCKK